MLVRFEVVAEVSDEDLNRLTREDLFAQLHDALSDNCPSPVIQDERGEDIDVDWTVKEIPAGEATS